MAAVLRVLGNIELEAGGGAVALGGNRQRAIVGYLALHHGRSVPTGALVDEVWGEEPPATVVKSLSTLVSRLRVLLDPTGHRLVHDGAGYRLDVPADGLDLVQFRDGVTQSRVAELAGDVVGAIGHLQGALDAFAGEPFQHIDAPFVPATAAALHTERSAAVEAMVRLLLRVGDHDRAIAMLEALVDGAPHREDHWAALVQAHVAAGEPDVARDVHARAVRLLARDLGLEPGEQLLAAARAIQQGAAAHGPAPSTLRTVGREAELAHLEANVQFAVAGGRRVQLILGEAGSGKSHLVRTLAERLAERGLPMLIGSCDPMRANPLGPLLQAIAGAEALGALPEGAFARFPAIAAALNGEVWSDDAATPGGIDAGDLHRRRILAEVAGLAVLLGQVHPLIIAIEDLHWADPFTLSVLHHMAHLDMSASICFMATARTPEFAGSQAGDVVQAVSGVMQVDTLELGPLPSEALRELVVGVLPPHDRTDEVLAGIERGAGGNPLYALHLARHVADQGAAVALEGAPPADTLELFDARIAAVNPRARHLIEVAATLGSEFSIDLLHEVFREGPLTMMHRVNDARAAGLIEPVDERGRYRFVHGLIRRAAYERVDRQRRADLHVTAAELLGYGDGAATLEIAEHLWRARWVVRHDKVAQAIVEACRPTIGFGALDAAERLLTHGLELDAPPPLRADLQVLLGEVLLATGRAEEGQKHLLEGRELAASIGRWDLYADAVLAGQRRGIPPTIEDAEACDHLVERALTSGEVDVERRIRLLMYRGDLLVNVDVPLAGATIDAAAGLLERWPNRPLSRRLSWLRMRQLESLGHDPVAVAAEAEAVLGDAEQADDIVAAALAGVALQRARVRGGRFRDIIRDAPRLRARADEGGRPELSFELEMARLAAVIAVDPVPSADAASRAFNAEWGAAGMAAVATTRLGHAWVFRREQLRLQEIVDVIDRTVHALKRPGIATWLAACHLEQGRAASARALHAGLVDEVLARPHDWARVGILAIIADLDADLGRDDEADALYEHLLPAAGQVAVVSGSAQVVGRVDRYLGRVARLRGDLDAAIDHFAGSRELDRASGAGLWVAWAAHDEASARLCRGRPGDAEAAAQLLTSAAATAKRYGSRRLTNAVRLTRAAAP